MDDLISRQAAIELCDWYQREFSECDYAFGELSNEISKLPSAQKHGKWEAVGIPGWKCSCCGMAIVLDIKFDGNYCPNCGARMDGETDG